MVSAVCFLLDKNKLRRFRINNLPDWTLKSKIMEVKIKNGEEMIDATIEMVDGNMVVSPKVEKYMYKEGDVIIVRSLYKHILIYKESTKGYLYSFADLIDDLLDIDKSPVCREDEIKEIRYATEKEKQKLFDKLKEEGYEWDAEKKEVVKLKWKPKVGDTYYRPDFNRCMFMCYEGRCRYNTMRYIKDCIEKGWCFKTKEECQEFCNRLNNAINQVKS